VSVGPSCYSAMVCPDAFDLAVVATSGCFAAISLPFDECFVVTVVGLLVSRCFAAMSVEAAPLFGSLLEGWLRMLGRLES
jgi:hypothetical protein